MARKKVTVEWIQNDAKRRAALKKRRQGLMKKAKELAILCDVPVCAVVYENGSTQPEVWPAEPEAAKGILRRFRAIPESQQAKKRVDQQGFMRQQIVLMEQKLKKMKWENKELEMRMLMNQGFVGKSLMGMGPDEALILDRLIDEKAEVVRGWIEELKEVSNADGQPNPNPNPTPNPTAESRENTWLGFIGGGHPQGVHMQPQPPLQPLPPCMRIGTGMGMMEHGGPSSWMMDHSSSSSSSAFFYPHYHI